MVNEDERKRLRWSAVDVLLVLLALLAAVSAGVYLRYRARAAEGETEILCVMRISGESRTLVEAHGGNLIAVGDLVRNGNGTAVMGRVEAVRETEHLCAVLEDGTPTWRADEALVDLELTVLMRGQHREGDGIRVKDLRIAAGGRGGFRIGNYYSVAEILSVEVLSGT